MVVNGQSVGPFTLSELILNPELKADTLVWKPGQNGWIPAKEIEELKVKFKGTDNGINNRFVNNPQYNPDHRYEKETRYYQGYGPDRDGYRPPFRTNWLPWAIVATIVGFFASCIGAIFGIIGIVQANKANSLYAQGFDKEGDMANSNAKIMTIIGLVFAGIGIIIAFSFGGLIRSLSNFSYL